MVPCSIGKKMKKTRFNTISKGAHYLSIYPIVIGAPFVRCRRKNSVYYGATKSNYLS